MKNNFYIKRYNRAKRARELQNKNEAESKNRFNQAYWKAEKILKEYVECG